MKYYNTFEVADILGYEVETIREYIKSNKLKAFKIGKEWRIKEEDLTAFIEGDKTKEVRYE